MTCKDCIHYEICNKRKNSISLDPMGCGYKCPDFKDKSRFIELPCKVGDTVYVIRKIPNSVIKPFITEEKIEPWAVTYENIMGGHSRILIEEFNNSVFLTKEEAEAKLKELQNE